MSKKEDIVRRLKTAEGHLKKVRKMVEDDEYCIDILQQSTAVKNAISKTEAEILDNHLHTCVVDGIESGDEEVVDEILQIFKKVNK